MSRSRTTLVALVSVTALVAGTYTAVRPTGRTLSASPAGPTTEAAASLDSLPLAFEPNRGQTDPEVAFVARGHGSTLFITPTESVLRLGSGGALRMQLIGANPRPTIEGVEPLAAAVNHISGPDRGGWQEGLPSYSRVASRDVYPGVDLVWHGSRVAPEYDFVIDPGVDPGIIGFSMTGASDLRLDGGELVGTVGGSEVRQGAPVAFQEIDGARRPVESSYSIGEAGALGFRLGRYDTTLPLVIDPVLRSQFTGGTGIDEANDIAVDADGNVYVAGFTASTDFPVLNSIDSDDSEEDAFVYKLDPTGALVYSTYLSSGAQSGGGGTFFGDRAMGVDVDESGNAYVAGFTLGGSFPTTPGALDASRTFDDVGNTGGTISYVTSSPVFAPSDVGRAVSGQNIAPGSRIAAVVSSTEADFNLATTGAGSALDLTIGGYTNQQAGFITKLNPTGGLTGGYSARLSGPATQQSFPNTQVLGIEVREGFAYVTGETRHPAFPTVNPIQTDRSGADAFVSKLSQDGTALEWSTYLGGDAGGNNERGTSIDVDSAGAIYVAGMTNSATGFPMVNAYQPTIGGGIDAFLTKIDAAGGQVLYSTYLGGAGNEISNSNSNIVVAADDADNAYLALTTAAVLPTTPGAFRGSSTGENVFVAKLNTATTGLASLAYATYLGGGGPFAIELDDDRNAYVAGKTLDGGFPSASPVQGMGRPLSEAFVTKLNAAGTGLVWSTFLGGNGGLSADEAAKGLAIDPSGAVWVAGASDSTDFTHRSGAPTPTMSGARDSFVVKLSAGHSQRIADFTADGRTEPSVFRPSTSTWYVQGGPALQWGTVGDIPVPGDYDEDGFSDPAVFRPSNGTWYVAGVEELVLGTAGDVPVPGDYDGDGAVEPAVYRPSTQSWMLSDGAPITFGAAGDIPVPGDYDADGDTEPAMFRPSNGTWYAASGLQVQFGVSGDVPVPGDYDGDGFTEPAVFRPGTGTWYARSGLEAAFGLLGDIPVPGDYNADGRTDVGIFRPSSGSWYTRVGVESSWGAPGDRPLPLPAAIRQVYVP